MTTHSIKLDLDKTLQLPPPTITARQGDTQCGITAMVTDHGAPATLTGYTAKFQAAKPDGTYAEQAAQISGSTVAVELDPQFLAAAGLIRTAYFRFFEGTAEKESTQNMCIRVIHDAEGEAPDLSTSYIPTVDQLVEDATEALNSANTALGNAEEALEDAEAATDSATDAAASANAAANAAQSAIDAMTGNVLRGTVGPSEVVSVDDAYPQVPLGVKVKGLTRQNLWVNPTGARNGITVASNNDGSVSISGTATSGAYIGSENVYTLKPNTQYTVSTNKLASFQGFFVSQFFDDGTSDGGTYFGTSATGGTTKTFTTADNLRYVRFGLGVHPSTSGTTYSGTYRIMLNEGSEAQPWCPPGLNSVDELSLVTAGKNLLNEDAPTADGVVGPQLPPGDYALSGTLPSGASLKLLNGGADGETITDTSSLPHSFTAGHPFTPYYAGVGGYATNLQLELGSTATAYEPPNIISTPIDLSSNALRSLPDGTCDVLTIGEDGTAGIEKAVESVIYPSSVGGYTQEIDSKRISFDLPATSAVGAGENSGHVIADKMAIRPDASFDTTRTEAYVAQYYAYAQVGTANSAEDILAVCSGMEMQYPLANVGDVTLPAVTLPALPGPTANVWAVATDGHGNTFTLQPEIELEYARDVTLVIGSLEAKVAALELLHESE